MAWRSDPSPYLFPPIYHAVDEIGDNLPSDQQLLISRPHGSLTAWCAAPRGLSFDEAEVLSDREMTAILSL